MLKYFKELLATLKAIEQHLSHLAHCVKVDHHRHGDRYSMSTKHWND